MIVLFEVVFTMWTYLECDVRIQENADIPRHQWKFWDPILLTECLYAILMFATWVKLYYLLSISNAIGKLSVSGMETCIYDKIII